jgi:hypothetical protein
MIESLKSAAAINAAMFARPAAEPVEDRDQAEPKPFRLPEPQYGEAATLSGAIQRLIAERDTHKDRVVNQEAELARLRAVNEELRRQHDQTAALRDHYMRLASEMLTTLKHIDTTIHELVQKSVGPSAAESFDATLMSLARRLSPKGAANDHGEQRS